MEICSTNTTQASLFDFPFRDALKFNDTKIRYLTVVNGEKKMEIEVALAVKIDDNTPLRPMIVEMGWVFMNVLTNDGEMFRIGLKTDNYAKINHFLVIDNLANLITKKDERPLTLSTTGLTEDQYEILMAYYEEKKSDFEQLTKPQFIKRNEPTLPRSIVTIPKGPHKGTYALLKTHGGAKEVGLGTFARITLALPLHAELPLYPRNLKACRTLEITDEVLQEAKTNKILLENTDLFAVGTKYKFVGPIRRRRCEVDQRELNGEKDHLTQEQNVKKIGYIMDYFERGDLFDLIYDEELCNFSTKQIIAFTIKYAYALSVLNNKYKVIHCDQKPENIFLNDELYPFIGDFGFSIKSGEIKEGCGSNCYLSPEVLQILLDNRQSEINASIDIWTLGIIFLSVIGGLELWQELSGQHSEESINFILYDDNLEKIKTEIFNDLKGTSEAADLLIPIINRCLQKDPKDRINIDDVVNTLVLIYYSLGAEKVDAVD
jgi:hypothetical protein